MTATVGGLVNVSDLPTDTGWVVPTYTADTGTDIEIEGRIYGNIATLYVYAVLDIPTVPTSGNIVNQDILTVTDPRFIPASAGKEQGLGNGGRGRLQSVAIWPDGRVRLCALAPSSDWSSSQSLTDNEVSATGTYFV